MPVFLAVQVSKRWIHKSREICIHTPKELKRLEEWNSPHQKSRIAKKEDQLYARLLHVLFLF